MNRLDQYAEIIRQTAEEVGVPEPLLYAIAQVESSGDTWAQRYEPGFFRRYIEPMGAVKRFGQASAATERHARATSWGLLQIMGQVARERGFDGAFLSELCHPRIGLFWGAKQLDHLHRRWHAKLGWEGVIRAYNTGRPIPSERGDAYAAKVRKALLEYGYELNNL